MMMPKALLPQSTTAGPAAAGPARQAPTPGGGPLHASPRMTAQRRQLVSAFGTAAALQRAIGGVNQDNRNGIFRVFVNGQAFGAAVNFGFGVGDTVGVLRTRIEQVYALAPLVMTDAHDAALADATALLDGGIYQASINMVVPDGGGDGDGDGGDGGGGGDGGDDDGGGDGDGDGDIWTGPNTVIPAGGVFEIEL